MKNIISTKISVFQPYIIIIIWNIFKTMSIKSTYIYIYIWYMKFQVDMKINGVYYVLYIKLLSSSSLICYNYKYTMHSVYMYKVYLVWATFFSSSTSTFFSRYYRLEFIPYLFIFFSLSLSLYLIKPMCLYIHVINLTETNCL